jgi:hypothetical protein
VYEGHGVTIATGEDETEAEGEVIAIDEEW